MNNNLRGRAFACILYEDSQSYDFNSVLEKIINNFEYYAYIKHKPEKEENKEHYHVVFYFPNKRLLSSLSNELGVPVNYFEKCNLKPYLKYLIHYDNEEKIQYSIDDVHGTLKDKLIDIISFNKEENQFSEILLFIESSHKRLSFTDLTYFCVKSSFYSCYRRNINAFRLLLEEHNKKYLY